jgi:uncharacterized membrane protein YgdD (TMEM256/DUF423 family)
MQRLFFIAGCLFACAGVGLGAFAAHALKSVLDAPALATFETGVRYQMYHALALLAAAWAQSVFPGRLAVASGWLFIAGIVVFSGTLYAIVLTQTRWLGAVTPFGGLALLAGWLCLALAAWNATQAG